jgi:hypothetical protein
MARRAARPLNRHQGAWRNVAIGVVLVWALAVALDPFPDRGGGSGGGSPDRVLRGSGSANEVAGTAGPPVGGGASNVPSPASADDVPVLGAPPAGASRRATSTSGPAPAAGGDPDAPVSDLGPPRPPVDGDGTTAVTTIPVVPPTTAVTRAPAPVPLTTPPPEELASVEPAPPVDLPDDDGDDDAEEGDGADDDGGPGRGRGRGRSGDDRGPNGPKDEDD